MFLHLQDAIADERHALQIPAAQADVALKELSRQSGYPVIFRTSEVTAVQTNAIAGQFTVQEALSLMFEGTPLMGGLSLEEVVTVSFRHIEEPTGEKTMGKNLSDKRVPLLKRLGTAIATAIFATSGGTAIAADEASADSNEVVIEEIVVTATKRETSLQDAPVAVTAFTTEDIERQGMENWNDISIRSPSVVAHGIAPGSQKLTIRGITTNAGVASNGEQKTVQIYYDDIPVTSGSVATADMRLYDIERVEVLRGPQGTTFGAGSLGGPSVLLRTKRLRKRLTLLSVPTSEAQPTVARVSATTVWSMSPSRIPWHCE